MMRRQVRVAVCAAVREGGGRGGEGQVADVVVSIVRRRSAAAVFAVIVLEMTGEEVHVVIQKVISVQVSVSGGLVGEKVVIVEIRRGRERVESGERVQHGVHLCLPPVAAETMTRHCLLSCVCVLAAHGQQLVLVEEQARETSL